MASNKLKDLLSQLNRNNVYQNNEVSMSLRDDTRNSAFKKENNIDNIFDINNDAPVIDGNSFFDKNLSNSKINNFPAQNENYPSSKYIDPIGDYANKNNNYNHNNNPSINQFQNINNQVDDMKFADSIAEINLDNSSMMRQRDSNKMVGNIYNNYLTGLTSNGNANKEPENKPSLKFEIGKNTQNDENKKNSSKNFNLFSRNENPFSTDNDNKFNFISKEEDDNRFNFQSKGEESDNRFNFQSKGEEDDNRLNFQSKEESKVVCDDFELLEQSKASIYNSNANKLSNLEQIKKLSNQSIPLVIDNKKESSKLIQNIDDNSK